MKRRSFTFIMLLLVVFSFVNAQNWQLVWSDEFEYTGEPDPEKWSYTIWEPGMVNNEYQAYTNRSENVRVENGALIIEGRRDWGNGYEYTSGRINSSAKGAFTYGRMEARMILPGGSGTWPAFWMMPDNPYTYATTCDETTGWDADCDAWPNSGEIDIMEYVGNDYGNVHGSIHSKHYYFKLGNQRTGHTYVADPETNYHVYAIEWFEDHIDYFVDDKKYYTAWNDGTGWESWPFNHDFHIILNLAIGGDWGAAGGFNPAVFEAGAKMYVDYVRVYEADSLPNICNAIAIPALIEAEDYCNYYGIQTEGSSDVGGGTNIGYIDSADWLDYTINVPSSGLYDIDFRVASLNGGGVFEILSNDQLIATVNVPATGDWQNWTTISEQIQLEAGEQILKINTLNGGYNLNWFDLKTVAPELISIVVIPDTASINQGESLQFIANGYDQYGNLFSTTFNWSTSGGTIDANGLFTASDNGDFTVTAESGTVSGLASVHVNPVISGVTIPALIEAEEWTGMSGVQTEACSEGGLNIGWIDNGDWMSYSIVVPTAGIYTVNYRVASLSNGGSLQLENEDGSVVYGSKSFEATGDWQNWITVSHQVQLEEGTQLIKISALEAGWNINWIEIASTPVYTLSTSVIGNGEIVIEPSGGEYPEGTEVVVTATAYEGSSFSAWSGDASGNESSIAIVMNGDKTVTAEFTAIESILIEAEEFALMNGIQTESCIEGGLNVGYTDQGDWMIYQGVDIPVAGAYTVEYRVASQNGSGVFQLEQNAGASVLGQIDVPYTGAWQNWTTVSHIVQIDNPGVQDFGIGISEGGFNLNWIKFTPGNGLKSADDSDRNFMAEEFKLYPNPVNELLTIEGYFSASESAEIYNLLGERILFYSLHEGVNYIDVSLLKAGVYTVRIDNSVRRFIKK